MQDINWHNLAMKLVTQKNQKWWILAVVALTQIIINLDFTAVNLALAPIAKDFYIPMLTVQWVSNTFIVASGALMILSGRLSEVFGKKGFFIIGATVFTVASILGGVAPNIATLLVGRLIQGVGFAILFPVSMAVVYDVFPENKKGLAIGSVIAVGGLAQALGPSVGGILIHLLSWRWIFFINIPIGFLCAICAFFVISKEEQLVTNQPIDYLGSVLLAVLLTLIMLFFNSNDLFFSRFGLAMLFAGIAIFVSLIFTESRRKFPIINTQLLRNRNFVIYSLTRMLYGFGFFTILFILGLYLQNVLGYGSVKAGAIILCFSLVYGFFCPLMGRLIDVTGVRMNLAIGLLVSAIGFIAVTFVDVPQTWHAFIVPLLLMGIGVTFIIPANATAYLKSVNPANTSSASGLYYTAAMIFGALGIASTALLIHHLSLQFVKISLAAKKISLSAAEFKFLTHVAGGTNSIHNIEHHFSTSLVPQLISVAQHAFLRGFDIAMYCSAFFSLFALALLLFIKKDK